MESEYSINEKKCDYDTFTTAVMAVLFHLTVFDKFLTFPAV